LTPQADEIENFLHETERTPMCRSAFFASLVAIPAVAHAAETQQQATSTREESISGLVAGASLTVTKTLVKYPLDTATVRLQMPNSTYSIRHPVALFDGAYRGVAAPLIANIPAGAVFFAVKDATKAALSTSGMGRWTATCLSVAVAQIPYWVREQWG
jgi:solute carrier family 25 S-adenosylmethionine transporter 26